MRLLFQPDIIKNFSMNGDYMSREIFRALSNIQDQAFCKKNFFSKKAVSQITIFCKKHFLKLFYVNLNVT